jgi:hypothetical protein
MARLQDAGGLFFCANRVNRAILDKRYWKNTVKYVKILHIIGEENSE